MGARRPPGSAQITLAYGVLLGATLLVQTGLPATVPAQSAAQFFPYAPPAFAMLIALASEQIASWIKSRVDGVWDEIAAYTDIHPKNPDLVIPGAGRTPRDRIVEAAGDAAEQASFVIAVIATIVAYLDLLSAPGVALLAAISAGIGLFLSAAVLSEWRRFEVGESTAVAWSILGRAFRRIWIPRLLLVVFNLALCVLLWNDLHPVGH